MMTFRKTIKQVEATRMIGGDALHNFCYGGSRSGKTFNFLRAIVIRASKEKSRHAALRKTFNSIKRSVWLDTLPKVMSISFPDLPYDVNKSDFYITLPNGSEIWIAGLDDDKRVEKILGMEFSTIFFNECSEISYNSVQIAITRLAEKNNLKKKLYYDANPPSKSHWTYHQFINKLNPEDNEPLSNPSNYVSLLMNPIDNLDNIDEGYLDILKAMSEKDRNRFLLGLFNDDSDGQVYYAFNREKHVQDVNYRGGTYFIGMDFNVDPMTAVLFQIADDKLEVFDEVFLRNSDTIKMGHELKKRNYGAGKVIPDSTGKNRKTSGKSDFQILTEAGFQIMPTFNPFVTDRVNNVNRLFSNDSIIINPRCKKLINDLEKVVWKDNQLDQKSDKLLTHISDCLGYGAYKMMPMHKIEGKFESYKGM